MVPRVECRGKFPSLVTRHSSLVFCLSPPPTSTTTPSSTTSTATTPGASSATASRSTTTSGETLPAAGATVAKVSGAAPSTIDTLKSTSTDPRTIPRIIYRLQEPLDTGGYLGQTRHRHQIGPDGYLAARQLHRDRQDLPGRAVVFLVRLVHETAREPERFASESLY